MDCNFLTGDGRFNFRVGAVIIHNGKLLGAHDKGVDSDGFNYLPGGRVRLHETIEEALRRELREELGMEAQIVRPLWLWESFFGHDEPPHHGFEMFFLVEPDLDALPSLDGPFTVEEPDGTRHGFRWVSLDAPDFFVYPDFVCQSLPNLPEKLTYVSDTSGRNTPPGMDVKYLTPEGLFNYRTAGVIVHDGLLLAMKEEGITHYYLPGGRVRLHETAGEALCREINEELSVRASTGRPLWLCESFFSLEIDGKATPVHELAIYFLTELEWDKLPSLTGSFTLRDSDGDEHIFTWLHPEEVRSAAIYPIVLKECWPELPEHFGFVSDTRDRRNI